MHRIGADAATKARLAVDGEQVFIGSFNFDPRSRHLNTEMGVLIDSPRIARTMTEMFTTWLPAISYRPVLAEGGGIAWDERLPDGRVLRHDTEPGTSLASRLALRLLGFLPIQWLL